MAMLSSLSSKYRNIDCRDLGSRQLADLRDGLRQIESDEIQSAENGRLFIELLRKFREAVAENDKLHGENYPQLLNSLLSVGEDGLYSNSLRFIFELIQNVDDCEFVNPNDCRLDMRFDFNSNEIVLTYNEVGFSPFNVFAITGIAEAAKNVSASKNEIGEKGIGFKSVFGVAKRVLIQSGWFSFELYKENFTIPVAAYQSNEYCSGTRMTLYVAGSTQAIYRRIRDQYCRKEALFSKNPILFLNKLTSLKLYYDCWRSMEFEITRESILENEKIQREDDVLISVDLIDSDNSYNRKTTEIITCTRYTYPITYSRKACQSRYGETTLVGSNGGKTMRLQAVIPHVDDVDKVGTGGLYSFLPTQLAFTVPIVCHAPFKLDASREFVDPQGQDHSGGNLWFQETVRYMSELIDYAFQDWARICKQEILRYLPSRNDSLIAKNNGKENCLRCLESFKGSHYLNLPLFVSAKGAYKRASEVFCFDPNEKIIEHVKVAKLLGVSKELFLSPENVSVRKFGISVEQDVCNRMFCRALQTPSITYEALEYLNSIGYEYSEKQFPKDQELHFSAEQIECMMKQGDLADIISRIANEAVLNNRRARFYIDGANTKPVKQVIPGGFELSETPRIVENYMQYCSGACICLDIPGDKFLPCHNGIVLSNSDPLASFVEFCYQMDSKNTFSARMKLREASEKLDQCIENQSGTAEDYIRDLMNIRLTVKDSLGANGYRSYLKLILKSGTDQARFIQELLQNADDCSYPESTTPSFTLNQYGNTIVTEYNEVGFTRANIRAITAIGESTKNRILNGDLYSIGEKGVGFKTVFAIASEVKIYSGEYSFVLTANEPTIPRPIAGDKALVNGTKMEITLKDRTAVPLPKTSDILELCLCLRHLRDVTINGNKVTINDDAGKRTITIAGRSYEYAEYLHTFVVNNQSALEDRASGTRVVSPNQQIVCYVPEKATSKDYPLYVGLPTKHKIKISMVIDAPFALTTSRETIDESCSSWNDIIRKEMYDAIVEVIHARKGMDRANSLRFASRSSDLSNLRYLNDYDYLSRLRSERIVPTFDRKVFVSAVERKALQYPEVVIVLLGKLPSIECTGLRPEAVIDPATKDISNDLAKHIDSVFEALNCEVAPFSKVFPLLAQYAESFIEDDSFRKCFYEYLQDIPNDALAKYQDKLKDLKIIPVYGKHGGTQYISWVEDGVFVKKNTNISGESYWVLNEKILQKQMCEKMLDVNINEMNEAWERSKYQEHIQSIIKGSDTTSIYCFLIREFSIGALQKNNCRGLLLDLKEFIPLKNELGEIKDTELFLCACPTGYFPVEMLQSITVHKECYGFAEFIRCRNLSDIYYDDIKYDEILTADDIEALQDDYFLHSEEILKGFYRDGYLSDELIAGYNLEYLGMGRVSESYSEYVFPSAPVRNRARLIQHLKSLLNNPVTIFTEKVERSVQKGRQKNGIVFDLSGKDARTATLQIYTPDGARDIAFCQMCLRHKPYSLMEVNNLEKKPKYYFPQTRVALCLECSKRFEAYRENNRIRERYLERIRTANTEDCGNVEILIGNEDKLTFTATHLAEIQEIFKRMK